MTLGALWQALRALLVSRDFWVLSMAYGLTTGMYGSWATVLSLNLPGCDPQWIGWLSFSSTIAGNVGGLVLGRFADRFRHMKRLLVGLMAVSGLCFTGFAVFASPGLVNSVVCHADGSPGSGMWPLFVLGVLGGLFLNSAIPLFYELSLEVTYPIPEATVCIQLTNWNNIGCLIFLGIPVSQYGSAWMNWLFGGTIVVFTGLLVAFFREKTKRYDVDTGKGGAGKALIGDGEEVVGLIQ
jgi:FLVCR family MFS transporter